MNPKNPLLFVAGGLFAAGLAISSSRGAAAQDPVPAPGPAPAPIDAMALVVRVQELEKKLAALETWVASQREQAKLTAAALSEAEAAGFVPGANFKSREILLAAWRAAAAKAQEGAPEPQPPTKGRGGRPDGGR